MEAVGAAASGGIDQCCAEVVFAQKPLKCARRPRQPFRAVLGLPGGKARGNRRPRFDRLLIEGVRFVTDLPEALGANGSEASR